MWLWELNIFMSHIQTEQMSRIVNELDSIHFSIKKASQLVKEIGRQVNLLIIHFLFFCIIGSV